MKKAFTWLVAIFLINAVGLYYDWYLNYFWFDILLHFLGGFFIAMLMADYLKEHFLKNNKIKNALILLGATAFIGVTWEFLEYVANIILSPIIYEEFGVRTYFMGDLDDTISDLAMDIFGAITLIFAYFLKKRQA